MGNLVKLTFIFGGRGSVNATEGAKIVLTTSSGQIG